MEPTSTTPPAGKTKHRAAANVPRGGKQLSEVFDLAVAEWGRRPTFTLAWKTQAQALALGTELREALRAAGVATDAVTPKAQRLAALDQLIDGSKAKGKLKYVKKALALQYDEENDGKPYYGEFGIAKIGSEYTLPHDRGSRAEALLKLVAALAKPAHNLKNGKYGHAFWKAIADEYNDLQPKTARATGDRAAEVSDKNTLRAEAEDVLVALLFLLRANYPTTYKAERRKFGVLKESY